jgi:hypothetical protein
MPSIQLDSLMLCVLKVWILLIKGSCIEEQEWLSCEPWVLVSWSFRLQFLLIAAASWIILLLFVANRLQFSFRHVVLLSYMCARMKCKATGADWKKVKAVSLTGVEVVGLWDVEAPTFSRKSAHRGRWGCQLYAPAVIYPQEVSWYSFLLEADSTPRAIVRLEGLGQLKNPVALGIEFVIFRLVILN